MSGLSLAQEIKIFQPWAKIIFFITSKGFEERCVSEKGFPFKRLRYITGWKGISCVDRFKIYQYLISLCQKFRFLVGLVIDTAYCCIVIKKFGPDIIIGLGGYSSAPPISAAVLLSLPYVLIEQNLIPGKANRFFSRWAKEVYCHFPQSITWFKRACSVIVTGNPVRKDIFNISRAEAAKHLGLSVKKRTLLIIGGSQGAKAINKTIINSLPGLEQFSDTLQVIHCTGEQDYDEVKSAYDRSRIDAYVCPFMSNIGLAYCMADLVISRAGAGIIAEITAIGLPSILIPYPYAADNHQFHNAKALADEGACYLLNQGDFSSINAVKIITETLQDKEKYERMAGLSKGLGKPDAAMAILERMKGLIS